MTSYHGYDQGVEKGVGKRHKVEGGEHRGRVTTTAGIQLDNVSASRQSMNQTLYDDVLPERPGLPSTRELFIFDLRHE